MRGDLRLEWRPIGALLHATGNPKAHDILGIQASILEHGYLDPMLLDERTGQVVEGNGRLEALLEMERAARQPPAGVKVGADARWEVPVLVGVSFDDDAEARRYLLRHNRLTEVGGWVADDLAAMLRAIQDQQQPIDDLGWTPGELRRLLAEPVTLEERTTTKPQELAEQWRQKWGTAPGQLWRIPSRSQPGREHRLVIGDALAEAERALGGETPALGLHDPPYGVSAAERRGKVNAASSAAPRNVWRPIAGDQAPFDPRPLLAHADGRWPLVLWGGNYFAAGLPPTPGWIVWDKRVDLARNDFADCELAWANVAGPARVYRHRWNGMIRDSERGEARLHPTQKPVQLMQEIVGDHTEQGDAVHDAFMGSGTVLVACERIGRLCVGTELDPTYAATILERATVDGLSPRLG